MLLVVSSSTIASLLSSFSFFFFFICFHLKSSFLLKCSNMLLRKVRGVCLKAIFTGKRQKKKNSQQSHNDWFMLGLRLLAVFEVFNIACHSLYVFMNFMGGISLVNWQCVASFSNLFPFFFLFLLLGILFVNVHMWQWWW